MFIKNKYYTWYYNIINRARSRDISPDIYVEKHHIIPKSLGGSNSADNLVRLTAREHYICHRLLIKMTSGHNKRKMSYAVRRMMTGNRFQERVILNSKKYEYIRKYINKISYGRKHSEEDKLKISRALKGRKFTNTHKKNLSLSKKGKKQPDHVAEMLRNIRKGQKNTQGHKDKCSKALKGRKFTNDWKNNLSKNHANVSGSNNPRSKIWEVTSPSGEVTVVNGTMTQFCQSNNLPASVMRSIGRTGKQPKTGKCVGWVVKIIDS
jgi:5-methylcytosine-specific restriction endonuclease McrA